MPVISLLLCLVCMFQTEVCHSGTDLQECYLSFKGKVLYRGNKTTTFSGLQCQHWNRDYPHEHRKYKSHDFPMEKTVDEAQNFCRDPEDRGFLWCHTTDQKYKWQICSVPECLKPDCFEVVANTAAYSGHRHKTRTGVVCQRWDSQFPHPHGMKKLELFPDKSLAHAENFCRDPDHSGYPWCYTIQYQPERMDCGIRLCSDQCFDVSNGTESVYSGKKRTTITGLTCQRWDEQRPHQHNNIDVATFPDTSLTASENFCRDPERTGVPFCYTTEPSVRWETCGIPPCDEYRPNETALNIPNMDTGPNFVMLVCILVAFILSIPVMGCVFSRNEHTIEQNKLDDDVMALHRVYTIHAITPPKKVLAFIRKNRPWEITVTSKKSMETVDEISSNIRKQKGEKCSSSQCSSESKEITSTITQ